MPTKPTSLELHVNEGIYVVERAILDLLKPYDIYPGIRVEPETYYSQAGLPLRFLEVGPSKSTCLRVAVERQRGTIPWILYWTAFSDGHEVDEGQISTFQLQRLIPELVRVLEHHLQLLA